jgi:hypothetical protein
MLVIVAITTKALPFRSPPYHVCVRKLSTASIIYFATRGISDGASEGRNA